MREIKFNIFDKRYNSFMDSSDFIIDGEGDLFRNDRGEVSFRLNAKDYEICQYTGLKDYNGVEIFEGDIVKRVYVNDDDIGCIYWDKRVAAFLLDIGEYMGVTLEAAQHMEIIGNKFENPELLTQVK